MFPDDRIQTELDQMDSSYRLPLAEDMWPQLGHGIFGNWQRMMNVCKILRHVYLLGGMFWVAML